MVIALVVPAADPAGPLALLSAVCTHRKGFEELEKGAPECQVGGRARGTSGGCRPAFLPPLVLSFSPCPLSLRLPSLGPRRKLRQAN